MSISSNLQDLIEKLEKVNALYIVGCGFIGIEIAEECRRRLPDLNISIVEMLRHFLRHLPSAIDL